MGECSFNGAFIYKVATLEAGSTAAFYLFMDFLCFTGFLWFIELDSCITKTATQTSLR